MSPAELVRCHARRLGELSTECEELPPAAVVTRRGLVRKLGFEAAMHAQLAVEAGDPAAGRRWDAVAHALERAWTQAERAEPALLLLQEMLAGSTGAPTTGGTDDVTEAPALLALAS